MSAPETDRAALAAALSEALAAGTREAFEQLLTDDVRWGGEHGGDGCSGRAEAGVHYAGLLAAGNTVSITQISEAGGTSSQLLTARVQVTSPDTTRLPSVLTVRLTVRDGLIADILELDPPPSIELLYFDGCPHYEQFLPHLQQLLNDHQISAPIQLIRIESDDDAQRLRFLGSPSLRINGHDVDPTAAGRDTYGMQCRLYATPEGTTGTPPDQWILHALVADPTHEAAVHAVRTGDLPALRRLLEAHPDLATARLAGHGGRTLLHTATDWPGHFPNVAAAIAALIHAGADPNTGCLGPHAETPLHWAASSDDVEAIDALLAGGADINAPGAVIGDGTPLAAATAFGQWAAARRLLERGARTTLWEAAALGLLRQVEQHLATDEPTAQDITSSFWGACHGCQLDTAALLLEHGADINWIGWDGLTPLDAARRSQAPPHVTAWLEHNGAKPATHKG
jgi:hypothetical protein